MVDAPAPAAAEAAPTEEPGKNLLGDSRFAKLFEDEDFAIDENSHEFRLLNPSTSVDQPSRKERGLTAAEQEAIDEVPGSSPDDSESESEPERFTKPASSGKISTASYKRTNGRQPRMEGTSSSGVGATRDRSFASRAQNMQSRQKPTRRRGVVGEREVTFQPAGKSRQQQNRPPAPTAPTNNTSFKAKERRSASGNTFRKM